MRNGLPHLLAVVVTLCGLAAPAAHAATSSAPAPSGGNYIELGSSFTTDAQYEAWFVVRNGLRNDFDAICGDTFCEGEYSNIESLRYQCSVHRISGRIGSCAWSFAASDESIDPRTGRIVSQAKSWQCVTPLVAGTTAQQLLAALAVEHPLDAPLPMSTLTVYDGLAECL